MMIFGLVSLTTIATFVGGVIVGVFGHKYLASKAAAVEASVAKKL